MMQAVRAVHEDVIVRFLQLADNDIQIDLAKVVYVVCQHQRCIACKWCCCLLKLVRCRPNWLVVSLLHGLMTWATDCTPGAACCAVMSA